MNKLEIIFEGKHYEAALNEEDNIKVDNLLKSLDVNSNEEAFSDEDMENYCEVLSIYEKYVSKVIGVDEDDFALEEYNPSEGFKTTVQVIQIN